MLDSSRTLLIRYQHPGAGFSGGLTDRLKHFNLHEHFQRYPLLAEYDWLRPAFHVPVPEAWFHNWKNYPWHPRDLADAAPHWADFFDVQWWIKAEEIASEEWFVHPYFRKGHSGVDFLAHSTPNINRESWNVLCDSQGAEFAPSFDYFYEWQLFRFADVVHWTQGEHPHFWRPGAHANLVRYAQETPAERFDRPAIARGWDSRAKSFTWLAHFIAFDETFDNYSYHFAASQNNAEQSSKLSVGRHLREQRGRGALDLVRWLGIASLDIEHALKHDFLTLAQEWLWRKYDKSEAMLPLWRALQKQIQAAVDWLCLLNGKQPVDYLASLRYTFMGQLEWAPLENVLGYPLWLACRDVSKFIAEISSRYFGDSPKSLGPAYTPSPIELLSLCDYSPLFEQYLDALWRLLEESTHRQGADPFRPRSRASWYRVIAIVAFNMLEDALRKRDAIGASKSSKAKERSKQQVMREVACNLGGKGEDWDRWCKGERVNTEMELQKISESIKSAATRSELILAFALAVDGVRQGNAHPHGAAIDWLSADWAGPIFDALDVFVPWALRELQSSSS